MKKSVFISFLLLSASYGFGQQVDKKYWFKMDYAAEELHNELRSNKVDTILSAFYHYDNGRGNKATKVFYWKKNGKTFINAVQLKKNDSFKKFKQIEIINDSIFPFFFTNKLDTVTTTPEALLWVSHDYGYSVNVKYNKSEYQYYLRNINRRGNPSHLKSRFTEMIDKMLREYYLK